MRTIYANLPPVHRLCADLMMEGKTNAEIAKEVGLSFYAVCNRMRQLLVFTGAETRLQCANILAIERFEKEPRCNT